MQTATESSTDLIDGSIDEVAPEVFATMLDWERPAAISKKVSLVPESFMIGEVNESIGFGGRVTGTVFLSLSSEQASAMAESLIGQPLAADAEEVVDVVAELTNMIAGGIKTRLNDAGFETVMTIPSVIRGPSIRVAGKDVQFRLEKEFESTGSGGSFRVIMIGKVSNDS
jgi:CheY-specific phosphatase CheX